MGPHDLTTEESVRASYLAHGAELYRLAWATLHDPGLAEEAVQETFLRAWRAADRYDSRLASPRTWLFAIARNVLVDLCRARAVRPAVSEAGAADAPVGFEDEAVDRALVAWQVEEALRRITPGHRRVIVEVYYRQRPHAEIATDLGIPEGTLRSRLYYGLRALRLVLEEMGWRDDV